MPDVPERYEVIEELGRGAVAVVYRALDRQLRRPVALKVLHDAAAPQARERFLREAQTAARLHHPNLVTVHDAGEVGGRPYLVMELIVGHALNLRRPVRETVETLRKVALAVDEAHRLGIVHRDLKPGNILVDPDGEPHVVDFGLAHVMDARVQLTRTGSTLGTPLYMAPEQVAGRPDAIGPATDVYALGAMLYEALTGRPPHVAATSVELYERILREDPAAPTGARDLVIICQRAIDKDPRRRYATAGALAEDLRRYLEGAAIVARPPSVLYLVARRLRRHRAALAAVAALAVAVSAAWLVLRARARSEAELARAARRADEGEAYRRLLEKVRPVEAVISETRPHFYIADVDMKAKLQRVEEALASLEALVADPGAARHAELWAALGIGRYVLGDIAAAERALVKARERAPGDGRVAFHLGRVYVEMSMAVLTVRGAASMDERRARSRRFVARAEELFRAHAGWDGAGEIDRHLVEAYRALTTGDGTEVGRVCREGLGRFGNALGTEEYWMVISYARPPKARLDALDRAIERRPHYAWAFYIRAQTRRDLGEAEAARADAESAVRLCPSLADAWHLRGILRHEARDFEGALADYAEAIRRRPEEPQYRRNRGLARYESGDPAGALADFDETLRLYPESVETYSDRGLAREMTGDRAGARADFDEALRRDPGYVLALVNRGAWHATGGDADAALADFEEAFRLDATCMAALAGRANLRKARGDLDGAQRDYDEAVRLAPKSPEPYVGRAQLRLMRRDFDGALADADAGVALAPAMPEAYGVRGSVRAARGETAGAIEDYERALRLAPEGWPYREVTLQQLRKLRRVP